MLRDPPTSLQDAAPSSTFLRGPQRRKERGQEGPPAPAPKGGRMGPGGSPTGLVQLSRELGALLGAGAQVLSPSLTQSSPSSLTVPMLTRGDGPAGRGRGEKAVGQERREHSQLPFLKETEFQVSYKGQCPLCCCGC